MKLLRYSLLLLVVAIIAFGGATALAAESWAADPITGTRVGFASADFTIVAASWSGSAVDGKADGNGTLTITIKGKDGKTYTGTGEAEMKAGVMHGRVALKWSDGESYDGTYKAGERDGYGIYKFANGGVYEGEWKNNIYEGKGIFKYADGRVYEGDFKNNVPHGYGVGKDASGKIVHDGEWKDGKPVTTLKADNVLGVPWGATEEQAKDILLKRPNTIRVSYLDGKNGEHKWLYFGGPFAEFPDAWIYVHFYQGKMWQFRISWPLKDDQVMNRYEALKQGLTGRYGPASSEQGKYLDSRAWWSLGQNYYVNIEIGQNTFKLTPADPTSTTHPFRVYITYYNKDIVNILQGNTPGSTGGSKDY